MRRTNLITLTLVFGVLAGACSGSEEQPNNSPDPGLEDSGTPTDAGAPPTDGQPDGGEPDSGVPVPVTPPDPTNEVFDLTKLHQIDIVVEEQYLDALENDSENRVPCSITYDGQVIPNAGIRKKGGIGSVQPLDGKPGFSVKFNEFDKGKNLHTLTKLTINNAVQDPTFLHEHLGYEVYRRASIPAPRTAHGVLTLNGTPKGIYVVAESVDKKFLARSFGAKNDEGNLYEGPCCGDFVFDVGHVELKDEVEEMRTRDDLIALADIVKDTPDEQFAAAVSQKLDLERFITGYAIDAIFDHWDGYSFKTINNYYIYDNPADNRFVFMPHGMDQLFQNLYFDPYSWPNGRLSQRVREVPELDAKYSAEILHILNDIWDVPDLLARIDQATTVITSATQMDPRTKGDLASYAKHVEETRQAVIERKAYLLALDAVCGDGIQEGKEECDDGNTTVGDGCSAACSVEQCMSSSNKGKNYIFCADIHDITDARLICEAYGGSLAVPATAMENAWVMNTAFALASKSYWIGVDDEKNEGVYVKPDGTPATYFAWAPGKPNGAGTQNCVAIEIGLNGWNDKACAEEYGIICSLP